MIRAAGVAWAGEFPPLRCVRRQGRLQICRALRFPSKPAGCWPSDQDHFPCYGKITAEPLKSDLVRSHGLSVLATLAGQKSLTLSAVFCPFLPCNRVPAQP